jgi:hypothetical protein
MKKATIDLSLNNERIYRGCTVEKVAGRLNLTTPPKDAINIIGENTNKVIHDLVAEGVQEVTLTGPMAVWAYLVVFHAAVHRFSRVRYDDGRGNDLLVAAHG